MFVQLEFNIHLHRPRIDDTMVLSNCENVPSELNSEHMYIAENSLVTVADTRLEKLCHGVTVADRFILVNSDCVTTKDFVSVQDCFEYFKLMNY